MTQNNTTATIEQFLKSRYRNPLNNALDGLAVDENGDFIHYNVLIEQTYNELFKQMKLSEFVDDSFKKEFCKYFYNREIGLETFARFQIILEVTLNTECLNLLKARKFLLDKTIEDLNQSVEMYNDSTSKGDNQGLGVNNNTPQDRLSITYDNEIGERYGAIEYANALAENLGKFRNESHAKTHGWSGSSLGDRVNDLANIDDLTYNIFNTLDKLFLQVF